MEGIFSEKLLSRMDCDIHYWISVRAGAPWLVFMHGAGLDHRMFEEQLPAVREDYSILLWDTRGHGLSMPMRGKYSLRLVLEDMLAIMDQEGIEKATFIGQSMGGNLAQEMAFYHSEKVEALVLIDCTCNTMKLSGMEKFYLAAAPHLMDLYPWKVLVKQSAAASALRPEVRQYIMAAFQKVGKDRFVEIFLQTAACLHYEEGYKIDKHMLLVCGDQDYTGNIKKIAHNWAVSESHCSFYLLKNAGHCANQDQPEEFNRILKAFLDQEYAARNSRSSS